MGFTKLMNAPDVDEVQQREEVISSYSLWIAFLLVRNN